MTYDEYDAQKKQIRMEADKAIYKKNWNAQKAIDKLARECARSNNTVKIGDIVSGEGETIKVERIMTYLSYFDSYPACVYHGPKLTKAGKPYKSGATGSVWQKIEK